MNASIICTFVLITVISHSQAMPADPVFRIFGTQQDNPNVKVFSTYPTEKPLVKDNPNDLEKGTKKDDKYLKDQNDEESKLKGEVIPKTEIVSGYENETSEVEGVVPEEMAEKETSTVDGEGMESHAETEAGNEPEMKDKNKLSDVEQPNENNSKALIKTSETGGNNDFGLGMQIKVEPLVEEKEALPQEEIIPIGIENSANVLPPIELIEDEESFLSTLEDMESEPEILISAEPNIRTNAGVALPGLEPVEMSSSVASEGMDKSVDNEDSNMKTKMETNPDEIDMNESAPIIMSDATSVNDTPSGIELVIEPMDEVTEENLNSMVSTSEKLKPMVEFNIDASLGVAEQNEEMTTLATEMENEEPMTGEIGVSHPMPDSEKITPTVEAEVPLMLEDELVSKSEDNVDEGGKIEPEGIETPKPKISLKITTNEDQIEMVTTEATPDATETPTEESVHMAGFMSDESKMMMSPETPSNGEEEEEEKEAEVVPSTTDLTFILNVDEMMHETAEETTTQGAQDEMTTVPAVDESADMSTMDETTATDNMENSQAMDTMEDSSVMHTLDESSVKDAMDKSSAMDTMEEKIEKDDQEMVATTTETIPPVDPIELALQNEQLSNDQTLNETV